MAAVDMSLAFSGPLDRSWIPNRRAFHGHSQNLSSIMALEPRTSHYPLFIEPQHSHLAKTDDVAGRPIAQQREIQMSSDSSPARCIIDRIRTIKLDTPALRRAPFTFHHPPRETSLARGIPQDGSQNERPMMVAYTQDGAGCEPSAFAMTSARVQADDTEAKSGRDNSHTRNRSLQQRRTHGALTISSPTARQARGRPAGPMIWLPEEQVWLLADSEAVAGTAGSSGVKYPNSAPLTDAAGEGSTGRGRRGTRQNDQEVGERNRMHRSDSSPIRSQFLRLMIKGEDDTSFSAQDWTKGGYATGPSAVEEDAIWHAEQQARAHSRRDQDRFSPMLQQALVGVDMPVDSGPPAESLTVPGEEDIWASHAMRRSSTTGDIDNIANILAAAEYKAGAGQRRTIAQRRSGSLRSRVSTVGNEDYDFDPHAATLHIRGLKEGGHHQRRHSADEASTPGTSTDGYEHEWLASLVAQGGVPEGIFTPRGSVADPPVDGERTPRWSSRGPHGRVDTRLDEISPARSGISPVASDLSRSATAAAAGRLSRGRLMSVSTAAGDDLLGRMSMRDGGDVSPVSSHGRDSLYE